MPFVLANSRNPTRRRRAEDAVLHGLGYLVTPGEEKDVHGYIGAAEGADAGAGALGCEDALPDLGGGRYGDLAWTGMLTLARMLSWVEGSERQGRGVFEAAGVEAAKVSLVKDEDVVEGEAAGSFGGEVFFELRECGWTDFAQGVPECSGVAEVIAIRSRKADLVALRRTYALRFGNKS